MSKTSPADEGIEAAQRDVAALVEATGRLVAAMDLLDPDEPDPPLWAALRAALEPFAINTSTFSVVWQEVDLTATTTIGRQVYKSWATDAATWIDKSITGLTHEAAHEAIAQMDDSRIPIRNITLNREETA